MTDFDPAAPARCYAGWRPTNASFYARLDAVGERRAPAYRPQWMREEERRAEEARQAKADVVDELSAEDRVEISRIRADIARMRFELAMLALRRKVAWLDALHTKARHPSGYDPNQPRVPAGNPEGGEWTRETEGGGPGPIRLAQNDERIVNRHIRNNHINKTDEELAARIRREQFRGLFSKGGLDRNGSFDSEESARQLINDTLDKECRCRGRCRERARAKCVGDV